MNPETILISIGAVVIPYTVGKITTKLLGWTFDSPSVYWAFGGAVLAAIILPAGIIYDIISNC